ncbi:MAG: hypothetical protein Q8O46_02345 [bacterium]|nr:hypothetical protein [bacterium]
MPGDGDFLKSQRPTDYNKTLRHFMNSGKSGDRLTRLEFLEMAKGGNPMGSTSDPNFKGIRKEYYKDWKDEDFRQLLADFGFPIEE